jgi:hypothetical protein
MTCAARRATSILPPQTDQRQLLWPVDDNYSGRSIAVLTARAILLIPGGAGGSAQGLHGHGCAGQAVEANIGGRSEAGSSGGGRGHERAQRAADGRQAHCRRRPKAPRSWRTRSDPPASVWESEVVPMLVADTERALQATTVLHELRRRCPDGYEQSVLRTLQRRMADWRRGAWA